jgi:HEAT repeat protein
MNELQLALLELEKKDPLIRSDAAQLICELASEKRLSERVEFVPCVVQFLSDKQVEVRAAGLALSVLVLGADEAKEILVRHLTDSDLRIRIESTGRLADLVHADARGALAVALNDKEFSVRFEAARGMALLKHSAGLDVLYQGLDSKDFRFRAAGALAHLQDKASIPKLKAAFASWLIPHFDKTQMGAALAAMGERIGVEHLLSRMRGRENNVDRPMAIQYLGELEIVEAKETLVSIVRNKKDTARGTAARALGMLGGSDAVELLKQIVNDQTEFEDIRLDAAVGLLETKIPSARDAVSSAVFSSAEAKEEIAMLLGAI